MGGSKIVDYIWKNMSSSNLTIALLEEWNLTTNIQSRDIFTTAIKNAKRRKAYNKRTMEPLLIKFDKDVDEFLNSPACGKYFRTCNFLDSVEAEEEEREIYKSEIRSQMYSKRSVSLKRRRIEEEGEGSGEQYNQQVQQKRQHSSDADETLEQDHEETVSTPLERDDSFNSLDEQGERRSAWSYLEGGGCISWKPINHDSLLLQKLMRFRDANIKGARNGKQLNDLRALSLSYIFVFGHTLADSPTICEYLKLEDCSDYCKQVEIPNIDNISDLTSNLMELQKAYFSNIHQIDHFAFATNIGGLTGQILTNVYNSLIVWNDSPRLTECQYSEQNVFSLLLPLFAGQRVFEISKYDKTMSTLTDYRPDLMVTLKLKYTTSIEFFVCEIKKPGCAGNKYESDFVKLQREMKVIVDSQTNLGLDDPTSYGVLVEGFDFYLYKMTLPFDGEYRSVLISQFRTIRDAQDIMLLLPAITVLSYLKSKLDDLKSVILNTSRSRIGHSSKQAYQRRSYSKSVKKQ